MKAGSGDTLSIGVVIDIHPQQRDVIGFERQAIDSLRSTLAGATADGFVVGYSDRVQLVDDWSPVASGLKDASDRLTVDGAAGASGAVLNDGLMDALTRLSSSANGDRRGLIVIGEGNDGGSSAKFSRVLAMAKARHIQCFALLVAQHRSQVGRVRQFGFDLYRLSSGTKGKLYDVRTNPKLLDRALQDLLKRLTPPAAPVHVEPSSPQTERLDVAPTLSPIEPDRPDVTNGTNIVDTGLLQVEAGVQHARMGTQRSVGTPVTLRVGLFEWLEARISTDGFLQQTDTSSSVRGLGNVQVGAKVRLFADPGGIPVLSILPTITLPVASVGKGLGSGDYDFTIVALTGTDLGKTSHVDVNYGIGAIGAGHGLPHFVQQLVSVSASHSVTEQLSPYVEGYWFSKQDPDGGAVFSVDTGFIQAFTPRWAVDGGLAVGLTHAAPGLSVFAGMSVIVGDVLGDHGVIARQRKAARLQGRSH